TNTNGDVLLSTDDAACRQLTASAGALSTALSGACGHVLGPLARAVQLFPFSTTPNVGGEYKVSVIPQSRVVGVNSAAMRFRNGCGVKSDNFKILADCPGGVCGALQSAISGVKYFDSNANGLNDSGDPTLANWQINISLIPGAPVQKTTNA